MNDERGNQKFWSLVYNVYELSINFLEVYVIIAAARRICTLSFILVALCFATSAFSATHVDTPVPPGTDPARCDFVNFYHDETKNPKGPSKCDTDCDCDGERSCLAGTCDGLARPPVFTPETCHNKDYLYNEAWTVIGPGTCSDDCECDGLRSCVAGQCAGTAR